MVVLAWDSCIFIKVIMFRIDTIHYIIVFYINIIKENIWPPI
jgi:hypothetical protein